MVAIRGDLRPHYKLRHSKSHLRGKSNPKANPKKPILVEAEDLPGERNGVSVDTYQSFEKLAAAHTYDVDYRIVMRKVPRANVVVLAPHGGKIEFRTSEIATAIAGDNFSLYLFEGLMENNNRRLHVTSHHFDEPKCLDLLKAHAVVVSIHGCHGVGEAIYVGGLDDAGRTRVAEGLRRAWFDARATNHEFQGTDPMNICNRGLRGKGVQLELSRSLRNGLDLPRFAKVVRDSLI